MARWWWAVPLMALVGVAACGADDAEPTGSGSPEGDACAFSEDVPGLADSAEAVFDPLVRPTERSAALAATIETLSAWSEVFPPEVADDLAVIADSYRELDEAFAAGGYELDAFEASGGVALAVGLTDGRADAAYAEIEAWAEAECGVELGGSDEPGDAGEASFDPDSAALPFDPCTVPATVDLTDLVEVDLAEPDGGGSTSGDAYVDVGCTWRADDGSFVAVSAIAFEDLEAAGREIRSAASVFGGEVEDLADRFPAPAFAVVFDQQVSVTVLGAAAPFSVTAIRAADGGFEADRETAEAVARRLVDELVAVPGGVARETRPEAEAIDAEPLDPEAVVFPFDACEAVLSEAVVAVVPVSETDSSGGGSSTYQANDSCSAVGTAPDGTPVRVTVLAVAFRDEEAAAADLRNGSDGVAEVDLTTLPAGAFATSDEFWGDTVWVLDGDEPFGVRVAVADSDPLESRPDLAVAIAAGLAEH